MTGDGVETPCENERTEWMSTRLALPAKGVIAAFPTHASRRRRVEIVKWGGRGVCRACGATLRRVRVPGDIYQCLACRRQETLTTDTPMQGSRLDLVDWFVAAERYVIALPSLQGAPSIDALKAVTGCGRTAAARLRRVMNADFAPGGRRFLLRLVCTETVTVGEGIEPGAESDIERLIEQTGRR